MTRSTNMEHVEVLRDALRKAFRYGETHWQQADSEYSRDHRKAGETMDKFRAWADETAAAIAALSAPQSDDWVLVPREPSVGMWESAENAMIESECAYDAGEQAARSDAHSFPTMRIWQAVVGYRAMLAAAPQPPAEAQACGCGNPACVEPWEPGCGLGKSEQHVEAQPVAWEWEYVGNAPYPRGQTVARALHEMDPQNPPYPETWRPTRPLIYGDTAPPSAPVGVEAKDAEIEALRAEVAKQSAYAKRTHDWNTELLANNERLAEAIKAYKSECDNPAKDYVLRAKRRDEMFALLRDHDQEVGNG